MEIKNEPDFTCYGILCETYFKEFFHFVEYTFFIKSSI